MEVLLPHLNDAEATETLEWADAVLKTIQSDGEENEECQNGVNYLKSLPQRSQLIDEVDDLGTHQKRISKM